MSHSYTVLLVEDHDPLRQILAELLHARGFHILSTDRGQKAIELAKQNHLDLSILDMHLPGTTGLEVYQTIAREVRPLPSIMISGQATRQEARAALEAGFFSFLRKPLDIDHLDDCLKQLIQRHLRTLTEPPPQPPESGPVSPHW